MYTKENLLVIEQLELLYKSCLHTLRELDISFDQKHEDLSYHMCDIDESDLVMSADIIYDLLLQHDNYKDINTITQMVEHVKSHVIEFESFDSLEDYLQLSELEQEMGTNITVSNSLNSLMIELFENNEVTSIDELTSYLLGNECSELKFYHVTTDDKFVAVFI